MAVRRKVKMQLGGAVARTHGVPVLMQPDLEEFEGYLGVREGGRLAHLASLVPDGQVIVELGSFKGRSTCYLARGSKAGAGVPVHCVDYWESQGQEFARHYDRAARFAKPEIRDVFARQVAAARVKSLVTTHQAATTAVADGWARPVGLLFVDADHHVDAVRADIAAWVPHLAPGATVAFHDYGHPRFPGVAEAVDAWLPTVDVAEVTRTWTLLVARLAAPVDDPVDDAAEAREPTAAPGVTDDDDGGGDDEVGATS